MTYEVVMPYHLHMPSYFLGTFTEYPFKLTADYEHIFHKERLLSIPEEEHARYMPVMIYRRLRMLRRILRCAQKDNTVEELRTSAFVKELLADIHDTRYTFWRYPHWRLWQFLVSAGK